MEQSRPLPVPVLVLRSSGQGSTVAIRSGARTGTGREGRQLFGGRPPCELFARSFPLLTRGSTAE